MRVLVYAPQAKADLDEIFDTIAADDDATARRFVNRVRQATLRLGDFPFSGPERPEIGKGARSLNVDAYLVLYRVWVDHVLIARVVHGARNLTDMLRDDA
ncbi:toxin ParE1/3/4 [Sphingomonas zeicaulis]|uniref:type II toxin-antitoxin system RelE/ParE family toxin n=1 Tax=Sphingomonas zeicaulis TaxID=1632740 RepID=UPI003D19CD0F